MNGASSEDAGAPAAGRAKGVGRRVRRNAGMMLAAKILGGAAALAGLGFAARGLTTEEFGLLVFMHACVLFFSKVATFDSWLAVVRYAAGGLTGEEAARANAAQLGRVVRFCATLDLVAAVGAFAAATLAAWALAGAVDILDRASPHVFGYLVLILLNQKSASLGVLRLFDRYDLVALNSLILPFVRAGGCGAAWAVGAPFEAFVATWFLSSALNYLVLPALGIRELVRRGLWAAVAGGRPSLAAPAPGMWRFVAMTNVNRGLAAAAAQAPVLLAGGVGGAGYAALFRVAQEVAIILGKGTAMVDRVIYPEFTNLIARNEGARVPRFVLLCAGALMAIGAAVGVGFWFVGPAVLTAWMGPAYADASLLAVLLIVAAAIEAAVAPAFPAFYAADLVGRAILARAASLVVTVVGFVVLYGAMGPVGPGAAMIIGTLALLAATAWVAARHDWASSAAAEAERPDAPAARS
ncbi:MAG: hypothetical protein AAF676_03205 [Pseudomonadota bacterium]